MSRHTVVLQLGDDVSTDIIYPGRFMATVLPGETPHHAFADLPEFRRRLDARDLPLGAVIVAGRNFGCGSSREQAASCLQGLGLTVVARGFARIFLQNSINLGLRTIVCPTLEAAEGDVLELGEDEVRNVTRGTTHKTEPLPKARQAIIDAGGLIPYTRRRLQESASS
jgi:3-isopropylmalate/(R)-2-methylmalate dehydratase small subunit